MRLVFGLVLVVGMALAGFAVYMARDYISAYQSELAKERAANAQMVKTVEVFIAKRPLRYGQKLKREDVEAIRWPVDGVPKGAFRREKVLFPEGDKVLRTVTRAMEENEAILTMKVTAPGEDAGVSSRLAKGMRAFAIKVDVATGVSGFLRPGDRVDVYWTGKDVAGDDGRGGGNITKLIQSAVQLIAIDQTADEDRNRPTIARTVTVQATPLQVASLAQAQATGRLSLSLVGADDTAYIDSIEVDRRDLLGIEDRQVVKVQKKKICTVTTRKGAERVEVQVECPQEN